MAEASVSQSGLRKFYFYLTENIHPYSLIIAIVLDLLWTIPELAIGSCLEIPLMVGIFFICYSAVNSIQLNLAGDEKSAAQTKGLVFGIIAAVPFSVVGLLASVIYGLIYGLLKIVFGYDKYAMVVGKFVLEWAKFEGDVDKLLPSTYDYKDPDKKQIKKKLEFLVTKNQIAKNFFYTEINPIRETRNRVAHPFRGGLPTEQELENALNNLPFVRQGLRN